MLLHFPGGFFRVFVLCIGIRGWRGGVELRRFFDTLQQDFLVFPLHHAGHAEEVYDPPDFSDDAEAEEPQEYVLEGVAQVEVVHAEEDPQDVGGGFFLFPGGVEGEGVVFLLVGEPVQKGNVFAVEGGVHMIFLLKLLKKALFQFHGLPLGKGLAGVFGGRFDEADVSGHSFLHGHRWVDVGLEGFIEIHFGDFF